MDEYTKPPRSSTAPVTPGGKAHAHLVGFYESDSELNFSLVSFFIDGLRQNEAAIVIATAEHLKAFETSLLEKNLDVRSLEKTGQLILLDAKQTLSSLLKNGMPEPARFEKIMGGLIDKTATGFSKINAYGEMVGILWDQGNAEGTILLEKLWNDLAKTRQFRLLCGYGYQQFGNVRDAEAFDRICAQHDEVVCGLPSTSSQSASHSVAMLRQRDAALQKELKKRIQTESELIASKAALDDFFENAAVGLHWVGPDGTILRANRHELALLGYEKEEYVGHNITKFHVDATTINCILEKLTRQETIHDYPARLKCKDGSIKSVLITSNVYWKDGTFIHTRCFTRDVTHELEIEQALNESERLKEAVLDSSEDCIKVLDTSARLEFMNPGGLRTLGLSSFDQIKQKCWLDFFAGDCNKEAKRVFNSALGGKSDHFTPETVSEDGKERRHWSITATPISNSKGHIDRVLVTSRDVTEQFLAQKARQDFEREQAENKYRLIIESISDYAIFMLDPSGNVATWNEGAKRAKGYEQQEILGKHFSQFYTDDQKATLPHRLLEKAKRLGRSEDEGWRVRKDGTKFWANVTITALHNEQKKLVGFAKVTRDLSERKKAEDELKQAHKRVGEQARLFDTALSASPDFYYMLDLNHRFTYANRPLLELWGIPLEEAIGKNFRDLGYPEKLVELQRRDLDEALKGKVITGENSYTNPGGKEGFYEYTFIPVFDSQGRVTAISGTTRDVTSQRELLQARLDEQKRAIEFAEAARREKTLANERENFRNLFKQTPEMVCILRGPDHVFEFVNEAHIKVLGFDATGKAVREAQPESVEVHGILDDVYRTGKTAQLHEIPVTVGESLRYFNLTYAARHDLNGQTDGLMILGTEITPEVLARERLMRSEAALVEKTAQLQTMVDQMPMAVVFADASGKLVFANKQLARVWGHEFIPAQNIDEYREYVGFHADGRRFEGKDWPLARALTKGEVVVNEDVDVLRGDNTRAVIRLSAAPIKNSDGEIIGSVVVSDDVTQQKLFEQELKNAKIEADRANELKSAFLANMSHEIRTPLGAMVGFADLLRDPSLSREEHANYINILTRNGEQLLTIINDILDLSKVEAGHLTLEFQDTNPDEIVADVLSLMRVKANEKNLVLEFKAEPSMPPLLVSDSLRLRQILMNIVSNAVKFTQAGSVKVRGFGSEDTEFGKVIYFEVTDTGIGIPELEKDRIFQPFVQADGSLARRFGGTGLGLALSRCLAQSLGGDVSITKTVEGKGTTFLISIRDQPEKRTYETVGTDKDEVFVPPENLLAGLNVLVVDDSPDNRQLIWHFLSRYGAAVDFADNGLLGYRKALAGNFDIVLMDIQMPEMDGYTATSKLREVGYGKPIIALTAHAMTEVRKKCLLVGCTDHLTKPIKLNELVGSVAKFCNVVQASNV